MTIICAFAATQLAQGASDNEYMSLIAIILVILVILISLIQLSKLSKAFGHGFFFTLGLIFVSPIFMLILGFGGSKYRGNTTI